VSWLIPFVPLDSGTGFRLSTGYDDDFPAFLNFDAHDLNAGCSNGFDGLGDIALLESACPAGHC
jgi:hypothetical protein